MLMLWCAENDTYKHLLNLNEASTVGTLTYLTCDVVNPPPEQLFASPIMYLSSVQSSGGIVAIQYLLNLGVPCLHWLVAGRTSKGAKLAPLYALAFHMNRATTHKVKCVFLELLALWTSTAVDPAVADLIEATTSGSFTGNPGSMAFADRLLEALNWIQDQRDGKFAAFERAMHYSEDILAMLHVSQAYEVATKGDSSLHDPVTQPLLNAAEAVRRELKAKLGTDLTVADEYNPFFHTGNRVKLSAGTERQYRPWRDIWTVAEGLRAGTGRADKQDWARFTDHVIENLYKGGGPQG